MLSYDNPLLLMLDIHKFTDTRPEYLQCKVIELQGNHITSGRIIGTCDSS